MRQDKKYMEYDYNFEDSTIPIVIEYIEDNWQIICGPAENPFAFCQQKQKKQSGSFLRKEDIFEGDRSAFKKISADFYRGKKELETELRLLSVTGEYLWCKIVGRLLKDDQGELRRKVITVHNIEKLVSMKMEIFYQQEYDSLTGYFNFRKYKAKVEEKLLQGESKEYAIWYCDIRNFKLINDLWGYETGDRLLQHWSDCIASTLRHTDAFARISADKVSIFKAYDDKEEMRQYFFDMVVQLNEFPELKRHKFVVELACGIYCIGENNEQLSVDDMIDRANIAQKSVKYCGGNQFTEYSGKMREQILREKEIESDMNRALADGDFHVYLQGQVDIQNDFVIAGAEALVRWEREGEGSVLPGQFIPLFEKNGFIVALDRYVFEQVCLYVKKRMDESRRLFKISVNVSRITLFQPEFVSIYQSIKEKYNIPDGILELECTESIAIQNLQEIVKVSVDIRNQGFAFSMDDFGSGESSLNALKNLNIDVLKLDMGFFKNGLESQKDRVIVTSIITMAKSLGMCVVAEGIERMEEVLFLQEAGCDLVQGYVFTKPVPMQEFSEELDIKPESTRQIVPSWTKTAAFANIHSNRQDTGSLAENVSNGLVKCIYDSNFTVLFANDAFYTMIGYTKEEFQKECRNHFSELFISDVGEILTRLKKLLSEQDTAEIEIRIRRRDGFHIWVYDQIKYNGDGTFYCSIMDITDRKQTELDIEYSNMEIHAVLDNIPGGIGIYEVAGDKVKPLYLSEGVYRMNGYTSEESEQLFKDDIMRLIFDEDRELVAGEIHKAVKEKQDIDCTYRFHKKGKETGWANIRAKQYGAVNGNPRIYAIILDVTRQMEIEQELSVQKERFQMLEAIIADPLFEYDVAEDVLTYSVPSEDKLIGHRRYERYMERLAQGTLDRPHPKFYSTIQSYFLEAMECKVHGSFEYLVKMRSEYEWHLAEYASITGNNGNVIRIVGRIKNIDQEVQEREKIRRRADSDPLTGLYNRGAIKNVIQRYLDGIKKKEGYALMIVDVDDFKLINDQYGHTVGDEALIQISNKLKNAEPHKTIAGRFGGDEFILFCKDYSPEDVEQLAEFLLGELESVEADSHTIPIKCSIGIVYSNKKENDFTTLFDLADSILYQVKAKGKNHWRIYTF